MRSELRCLAAGQPSRPISVEAPLWSQVVGSAYREDQQRSVSPLHSLFQSFTSPPAFSLLSVVCPLPFWHYPPPPPFHVIPIKSLYIYSLSFSSHLLHSQDLFAGILNWFKFCKMQIKDVALDKKGLRLLIGLSSQSRPAYCLHGPFLPIFF